MSSDVNWLVRFRVVAWALLSISTLVALLGWLAGKDPSQLSSVIGWVTGAAAGGELANVGKRATWKAEAHEALSP